MLYYTVYKYTYDTDTSRHTHLQGSDTRVRTQKNPVG